MRQLDPSDQGSICCQAWLLSLTQLLLALRLGTFPSGLNLTSQEAVGFADEHHVSRIAVFAVLLSLYSCVRGGCGRGRGQLSSER